MSEMLQAEGRYAIAARAATDGLWDWDLKTNEVYYSPRWKAMLGLEAEQVGNSPDEWLKRVHSRDLGRLLGRLSDHLHRGTSHFESEHRVLHNDGNYRWMRSRGIAVRGESGEAIRIVGWQTDITDRKRAEDRLKHEAWHDPLTDLPNRAYFQGQLQRAASQASSQPDRVFALLFLDLDNFKTINDNLGHSVGDHLLIALSERLRHSVRPGDTIARLGGDEFAILLKNLKDKSEATQIAGRIQKEVALPFKVGEEEVRVSASIGIALSSDSHDKPTDLLRNADAAMYRAKSLGRNRHELFDAGKDSFTIEAHYLETDLRRALDRGDLRVHYQPIISLPSGRISGCEALIRWQHPEKGLIPPAEFLPVAEEIGLINPISEWLLKTACAQVRTWREAGLPAIRISLNIANQQFTSPGFLETVNQALAETGVDPTLLQLELTESAMMAATAAHLRPLTELCGRGVRVALDDFGMGYSSLVYLRRLPIHALKIDSFYIREITTDPGDATMASGLIALAHSLGLKLIGVKVETPEQLDFLREEECDEVQGDVICPPLKAEDCAQCLRQGFEMPRRAKQTAASAR